MITILISMTVIVVVIINYYYYSLSAETRDMEGWDSMTTGSA